MLARSAVRLSASARLPALARCAAARRPAPVHAHGLFARALATESATAASSSDAKAEAEATAAEAAETPPETEQPAAAEEAEAADGEAGPTMEEMQAKIEELEEKVSAKHDQVLRALAEADNARRRAQIDVENAHKFAVSKFAKSLLDVADNLSRAAESVPENQRADESNPVLKGLYDGVVMTETVLVKTFAEHNIKKQWPMDEKFDPNVHNALFEAPDPTKEPGTIMHVASAGYVLHDRVIRAAGVGVVAKPPS